MKIGIYGYGNVGKGVELATLQNNDVELFGIFTRRDKESIKTYTNANVYSVNDLLEYKNDIDVLIICSGSATELPLITPKLAENFNVVDSFDTHKKIPEHFKNVNEAAEKNKKVALISCGWDPGMFSLMRLFGESILPKGEDITFWGRGVSQGHSDAIRHIEGVVDARQYTVPREEALNMAKSGNIKKFTAREKHTRECFVVAEENANKEEIENKIKTMPNYFDEYDTTVHFITLDELKKNHSELPHAGTVVRAGVTGEGDCHKEIIEYNLKLDSNPEFTASCLVAFSRAIYKMMKRGEYGCKTVFDIRPIDLTNRSRDEVIKNIL